MRKEKVLKFCEERTGLETHRINKKSRNTMKKEKVSKHNEERKSL
jgi:hypothetical protein